MARRGRKSILQMDTATSQIVLKQHHFKYSDVFADKLAVFALSHLEDNNKQFKSAWKEWTDTNADSVQQEIANMKNAGYEGSVEDKMYFSARYYYRKKAKKEIQQENEPETQQEDEKTQRKAYELIDKELLQKMSEHILSQIRESITEEGVSEMTPSKAYKHYCQQFATSDSDALFKKNYKNMYWRISRQTGKKTR